MSRPPVKMLRRHSRNGGEESSGIQVGTWYMNAGKL